MDRTNMNTEDIKQRAMENKETANGKRKSGRNGRGRSSKSPHRRASSEDLDEADDNKKRRSSRSTRRQSSSGLSSSRHRSRSRDDSEDLSGRKDRLKSRMEEEQATKAAAKRNNSDARKYSTSLSLADSDAALKKKARASRSRTRSTESLGKPSRRGSSDDKAALKSARSSRRDPVKPGVEHVRHRHRGKSRDGDKLSMSNRSEAGMEKVRYRGSGNSREADKLSMSNRSDNIRVLSPEQNKKEIHLHATTVEGNDGLDEPEILVNQQRIHDLEQQRDNETKKNNKQGREEPPAAKTGASRLILFLLFLFGLGVGVVIGFFVRGGCEPCKKCETDSPTSSPTPEGTMAPTTLSPTIDFAYDPPSDEDCLRIQNLLPVEGQSELLVKRVDLLIDTSLTNESLEASNWPEVVVEAMAAFLIPDVVGCQGGGSNDVVQAQNSDSNDVGARRNLRNIRYVIANAIASGERRYSYSCEEGAPAPCYKAAMNLSLFLKGDEPNVSLFTLISDVILAYSNGSVPLVDKLGLPRNTFSFVNIVGMEEVPYEPSSEAACDAIANKLPVPGQEALIQKIFELGFEIKLANGEDDSNRWVQLFLEAIEEYLAPELACCGDSEDRNGRMLKESDFGRNLRCAVGNAVPITAKEIQQVSCQDNNSEQCVHAVVSLEVYLKGEESKEAIGNLIADAIVGASSSSIVDNYRLPSSTFSEINLIDVEGREPSDVTPSPTDSPSTSPTMAPVVGPTTDAPTSAPTPSPTRTQSSGPTRSPTSSPTLQTTPGPTIPLTPGPTPPPTPGPTLRPSISPSLSPTPLPSWAPSLSPQPSNTPSSAPSTRRSVLLEILSDHAPLRSTAIDWLAEQDTWLPPAESTNPDVLWSERYAMGSTVFVYLVAEIGILTDISVIHHWAAGGIVGPFPTQFGQLTKLTFLNLGANYNFGGSIPGDIFSGFTSLTLLNMHGIGLVGTIPSELAALPNLSHFRLDFNKLTGTIPTELGGNTALKLLSLNNNRIAGTIPTELGRLTTMTKLRLENNQLTGTVPQEFNNLNFTSSLALDGNSLTGSLPSDMGVKDGSCELDGNCFSNSLPGCSMDLNCA